MIFLDVPMFHVVNPRFFLVKLWLPSISALQHRLRHLHRLRAPARLRDGTPAKSKCCTCIRVCTLYMSICNIMSPVCICMYMCVLLIYVCVCVYYIYIYVCVCVGVQYVLYIYRLVDGQMDGWLAGWMDRQMDRCVCILCSAQQNKPKKMRGKVNPTI